VSPSEKRDNVIALFPESGTIEPPANFAEALEPAERVCVICSTSLAGRRAHAKTCSPTCRKKLSDQNKESTS